MMIRTQYQGKDNYRLSCSILTDNTETHSIIQDLPADSIIVYQDRMQSIMRSLIEEAMVYREYKGIKKG